MQLLEALTVSGVDVWTMCFPGGWAKNHLTFGWEYFKSSLMDKRGTKKRANANVKEHVKQNIDT